MIFIGGRNTKQLPKIRPSRATGILADKIGMPKKHHITRHTMPPMIPMAMASPIC